ncbi:hypothetical protein [Ideonella sp.]|uniref:hypothetical protein n=1 Tax=Ideonella sp. TaxID=1929293 RepID=UPI0035ADADF4
MKLPWTAPTARDIVDEVCALGHDQRFRRMIEFGRQSAENHRLAQALQTLAGSEVHYERMLALMAASGSRDAGVVASFLGDPSQSLALRAARLAARMVPDGVVSERMPDLAPLCRRTLAWRLWKAGRAHVNDAVHARLSQADRAHLLPWTSDAFIAARLGTDELASLAPSRWATLAQRLPALVRDLLLREIEEAEPISYVLRMRVVAALHGLLRQDRDAGLTLLAAAARRMPIPTLPIGRYAAHFPQAVAGILLDHAGAAGVGLAVNVLKRLDPQTVCALQLADALPNLQAVFARLTPPQRAALYGIASEVWRAPSGAVPVSLVRALSQETRQAEARRAFSARLLETEPMARVAYLGCLPFAEASQLAQPYLSQPDGELRAQAVAAVVHAARYESACLDAVLDFCMARENEQDPVRLAMFTALAALPVSRWGAGHLPRFTALIDAALRTRDCSSMTMSAAVQWLMGVIVTHPDFVVQTLPRLVERLGGIGRIGAAHWESRMSDREMRRVAPTLMPMLQTWVQRNQGGVAARLILAFGRRARAADCFTDLLFALARDGRANDARSGLEALAQIGPAKRMDEWIPPLLDSEPGWITVHTVAQHLHRNRQDLLTPFLTARRFSGRFSTAQAAFLPVFESGFERWTAAQQQLYGDSLLAILNSAKRNAWELYGVVQRYAAMPSLDLDPVIRLARLDSPDAALRDKALEALGRSDGGRGVSTLVSALDDARARVAIYALRQSVVAMPAAPALRLMAQVPRSKVTVAKEIVRLVGDLRSDAAYNFLATFDEDESLHPDVRIALLRAYWNFLDRPETWLRLRAAALDGPAALARSTIRVPQVGLTPEGQHAWGQHMALLLQHADALIRKETLERLVQMPPARGESSLRDALVGLLDDVDPVLVQLASQVLLATYGRTAGQALAADFAAVRRPHSLAAIVSAYRHLRREGAAELTTSAASLVDALIDRRWHVGQAVQVALTVLPPGPALDMLHRLHAKGLLHPGVVSDAVASMAQCAAGRSVPNLATLEGTLGAEASGALRRIGLGLLCELAVKGGWTFEARQRLQTYRRDPDQWVSDAADLVRVPLAEADGNRTGE